MNHRSFSTSPHTLNDCIQSVINAAPSRHLRHPNSGLGNMLRVHLGQTVLLVIAPSAMTDVLTIEPLGILSSLPGSGGNHERCTRCVRVAQQTLMLYSLSPDCRHRRINDLAHAGSVAYRLAADASASYDRWFGDVWWEMSDGFLEFATVVAESSRSLGRPT